MNEGKQSMSIKAVLFDLDGTLLPMDQEAFTKMYFKLLACWLAPKGYEPAKLVENIWAGTAAMVKNDGTCTNEDAFWKSFINAYGPKALEDKAYLDAFYSADFLRTKEICGFSGAVREILDLLHAKGKTLVLATNPIFPAVATENRMRWTGAVPEDFVLYTTYENCSACKPNPQYYRDIAQRIGVNPEECLMVGNDVQEDMVAQEIGMQVFLLTDCMINKKDRDISAYPQGGFNELKAYLETI